MGIGRGAFHASSCGNMASVEVLGASVKAILKAGPMTASSGGLASSGLGQALEVKRPALGTKRRPSLLKSRRLTLIA